MPIHSRRWLARIRRTLSPVSNRRAVTVGGRRGWVPNVKGLPSNLPIKLTVHAVTQLACASCAPAWPAAYRHR
jgi:hypothetical protein